MPQKAFRIAFRVEGKFWNVYLAVPVTMKDSILLGSIDMNIVTTSQERRRTFMDIFESYISDGTGVKEFEEQAAPESERSGTA